MAIDFIGMFREKQQTFLFANFMYVRYKVINLFICRLH